MLSHEFKRTTLTLAVFLFLANGVTAGPEGPRDPGGWAQLIEENGLIRDGSVLHLDEEPAFRAYSDANNAHMSCQEALARLASAQQVNNSLKATNSQLNDLKRNNQVCQEQQSILSAKNQYRLFKYWNNYDQAMHNRLKSQMLSNNKAIRAGEQYLEENRHLRSDDAKMRQLVTDSRYAKETSTTNLREAVSVMDRILEQYRLLEEDEALSAAIDAMSREIGKALKLGPSDKFKAIYGKIKKTGKLIRRATREEILRDSVTKEYRIACALEKTNREAALARYRKIVEQYPGLNKASDAEERIRQLSKDGE